MHGDKDKVGKSSIGKLNFETEEQPRKVTLAREK